MRELDESNDQCGGDEAMTDDAYQHNASAQIPNTWTLTLNRYQRDNLLYLLNCIGYPGDSPHLDPALTHWNTGDWLGEIVQMLAKQMPWNGAIYPANYVIDDDDRPNQVLRRDY